ncbi:diagnostic antigen gp50 [Echinococcus multilocularis]|uniref:Diagnostic antigen gp50 n=1 Tax=Echinococcus multilocularis TaxID=6211 RepID=A0A068XZ44_ECHMU|nr:diagnostic antigen gp50 [Echinococcus multilocularis]
MLRVIVVLIFAAYCSGANTPTLWGSRIVGKPSGPSDTMNYEIEGKFRILVNADVELSIVNDTCLLNGTEFWGSPCRKSEGNAAITVKDVTKQGSLIILKVGNLSVITSTTFFLPGCKFPPPEPDEVDLKTSFPLSRFVRDSKTFKVDFAVWGADSMSEVKFGINGEVYCTWLGTKLSVKNDSFCVDLVKDKRADLRVFHGVFQRKTNVSHDRFAFAGKNSGVVVSIDYTQSGISPEVAECSRKLMNWICNNFHIQRCPNIIFGNNTYEVEKIWIVNCNKCVGQTRPNSFPTNLTLLKCIERIFFQKLGLSICCI